MQTVTVGQMVRVLNTEPHGLASWEADAVRRMHQESHHGLRPWLLNLRQVELVNTIFHRLYHAA